MSKEQGLRQAYKTIKDAYKMKQRNPVTTSSDLKLLVPIVAGKTSYTFPVIQGDDTQNYPEAILLNRSDAFTAIEIGLFVGKKASVADTAYNLFTYGNIAEFGATDGVSLRTLFNNATLTATINNVQYLQNLSTERFRWTPQTQNGVLGYAAQATINVDQWNEESGYFPLVPTLQLSGTSKLDLVLNLPAALTTTNASTNTYVITLSLRGFLSLGASNLNK
jgi:hypothetical protein